MSLAEIDLVRYLPAPVRGLVEQSFVPVSFGFGDVIVREGAPADALYVLRSGQARVIASGDDGNEVLLDTLGPGDSFGEVGLLDAKATRSATVRASSPVEALRLDGGVFRALVKTNKDVRAAIEVLARRRALRSFLRLRAFAGLDREALVALADSVESAAVKSGAVVRAAPGAVAVVEEGVLEAEAEDAARSRRVTVGDAFELDGMSWRAVGPSSVLVLSKVAREALESMHPALGPAIGEAAARGRAVAETTYDIGEELLPADAAAAPPVTVEDIDDEAPALRRRRRRRRFPLVLQVDAADCGAAAVAMVCRSFGRRVALPRVRDALRTSIDGTSLRAIASGSERLGLRARTVKASKRNLDQLQLPALLHWDGNHWVVLYDVGPRSVRIANPAVGLQRLRRDEVLARWTGYAALLAPTLALHDVPEDAVGFSWLRPFFRQHRATLAAAAVMGLVVSALEFSLPLFTRTIVDEVVVARDFDRLQLVVTAMAAAGIAMAVGAVGQRLLLSSVAVGVDGRALDEVSTRLFALPLRYFLARRTGDIQRRLMGVRQAREFLVRSGVVAVNSVIELAVALILMFTLNRVLAFAYVAGMPVALALMRVSAARIRPVVDGLEESFGRYSSRQLDALRGIETVKALAAEDTLRRQLVSEFRALAQRLFRADLLMMLYDVGVQLLTFGLLAVFLWVGALQVLDGSLTIGGLVAFSALVGLANGPVTALLVLADDAQLASVLVDRLGDVFAAEPERTGGKSPELLGTVELKDVTFRYDPDAKPILEGLNLRVERGTTVAIVGRSGSGKTTLARCLSGLLQPTGGQIAFDGIAADDLDVAHLRRQIGVVLQESFLFADTIAANIAFGDDDPDRDRVVWAARVANAHDFVSRLPLGYDTRVGESGILLSGGQRQRIAIARAVYHRPPILILDEATSSLDAESERAVQTNMGRLLSGRTSFVIAHRLSTIRDADVVVVLEQGRIVEKGTHAQLMARQGLYHYLATEQLGL